MKKHIIYGCLLTVGALSLGSCDDFLTEEPLGSMVTETVYKSESDLNMAVYSLYYQAVAYQCNSNPMIIDCQGDDVTSTTGSNKAAYLSADVFETPSDYKGVNGTWNWMYSIINDANQIIANARRVNTSQEKINEALGQAYYWRAFAYFNLVRYYGQVPIIVKEAGEYDNNTPLGTIEEIYAQIISDLETADGLNLPAKYTEKPKGSDGANIYVSQQAVKATLAAVYLHKAGYPLNDSKAYAESAKYAKQVIDGVNSGKYDQSVQPWDQVYNYGNNHNNGCILGLSYQTNYGSWSNNDSQFSSCHQSGKLWGGWGDFLAERKFWVEAVEGPRKDNVYAKYILNEEMIAADWWATTDQQPYNGENAYVPDYRPMFIGFSVNKNDDGSPAAAPFDCFKPTWGGMCINKRHQLIRYTEVLCWYAEAVGRGNLADVAGAQEALRQVRANAYDAGNPLIAECATLTGNALAEAAYKEHGEEVAGNVLGMVTRRSDQFRMNRLKDAFDYRAGGCAGDVLVPAGTYTHVFVNGVLDEAKSYTLTEDIKVNDLISEYWTGGTWQGENSIYAPYPPTEVAKNPNLKR